MRLLAALKRLHRDDSGQAMVEFVLVFPVQLLLSLLILQFCFVAHAHLVVQQAAFLGARAGAVADVGPGKSFTDVGAWTADGKKAARRVAARTVGVLTSGEEPFSPPGLDGADDDKAMRWNGGSGTWGYSDPRRNEAFAHLTATGTSGGVEFLPYPDEGYVACAVTYDYVMVIPVANHVLARAQLVFNIGGSGTWNAASTERQRTCYRIRRVSFIPTPWTRVPQ